MRVAEVAELDAIRADGLFKSERIIRSPQAAEIVGGTPQQFDAFIKSELKRWPEVVKAAGIKPE